MGGFVAWAQTVDWQAWALFAQAVAIGIAAAVAAVEIGRSRKAIAREKILGIAHEIETEFERLTKWVPPTEYSLEGNAEARCHFILQEGFDPTKLVLENRQITFGISQIYFGKDASQAFDDFASLAHKVRASAEEILEIKSQGYDRMPPEIVQRLAELDENIKSENVLREVSTIVSRLYRIVGVKR
ncbi:hypothetical protein [Marinicauda salina]|uniref:hypothetical protein n=1 Tax=Marinicauda salina TaxID=2135793 RepID=UPI0011B256C0|nr:hypothetical protein [Marinicauda salina]